MNQDDDPDKQVNIIHDAVDRLWRQHDCPLAEIQKTLREVYEVHAAGRLNLGDGQPLPPEARWT